MADSKKTPKEVLERAYGSVGEPPAISFDIFNGKAQSPARGILQINDWGPSKMYRAVCQCGNDDCSHTLYIEADDGNVCVTIYTTQKTKWWKFNRWQKIWTLLTKGYVEYQADMVMDKQTALNYAGTLARAIKDCEEFEAKRKKK